MPIGLPAVYLLRLSLSQGNKVISLNEYWKSNQEGGRFDGFNQLAEAHLSAKIVKQQDGKVTFVVTNQTKVPAIGIKLNLRDPYTGKIILPANFSEGYFTLLPGEQKQIAADWNSATTKNTEVIGEAYNMKSHSLVMIK